MLRVTSFGAVSLDLRDTYIQRLKRLIPFEWKEIPLKRCPDTRPTNLLPEEEQFLKSAKNFHLLDVGGKQMNSDQLAKWCLGSQDRHLVVGPAIGFHEEFRKQSEGSLSLSTLTFTHAVAQLMLAESLYRSACILKNHPFVK